MAPKADSCAAVCKDGVVFAWERLRSPRGEVPVVAVTELLGTTAFRSLYRAMVILAVAAEPKNLRLDYRSERV